MKNSKQLNADSFYPAKLLLFGEYTIILGGDALAVPFNHFGGRWAYSKDPTPQDDLQPLLYYLKLNAENDNPDYKLDMEELSFQLKKGLYFSSDIPPGYGVGSSGALSAAILDQFGRNKESLLHDSGKLLQALSRIESFFHGKSSGIDPFVSYVQKPVLIHPDKRLDILGEQSLTMALDHLFLVDSNMSRQTGPLVEWFLNKYSQEKFSTQVDTRLMSYTSKAIEACLAGNRDLMGHYFKRISEFQLENFNKMIPGSLMETWTRGLEKGNYFIKLCGAGGGGYFLGFVFDKSEILELSIRQDIIPLAP